MLYSACALHFQTRMFCAFHSARSPIDARGCDLLRHCKSAIKADAAVSQSLPPETAGNKAKKLATLDLVNVQFKVRFSFFFPLLCLRPILRGKGARHDWICTGKDKQSTRTQSVKKVGPTVTGEQKYRQAALVERQLRHPC